MDGSDRRVKKCFKLFWAWQEEAEASWLEQMSLEGWSLSSVRGLRYTFVESAPERTVYRLDFKNAAADELEEYRQIYEDLGWEYVTRLGNWIYWRRPYEEDAITELYSDNSSRLERYRSQLNIILLALTPTWLFILAMSIRGARGWWVRPVQVGMVLLTVAIVYATGRIWRIVRQLESSPKE